MRLSARLLAASALALMFAAPAFAQDAATIQRAAVPLKAVATLFCLLSDPHDRHRHS